jgi:hypothetical protein
MFLKSQTDFKEANVMSKYPLLNLETLIDLLIKLATSLETITGFIPAFLFIKEV